MSFELQTVVWSTTILFGLLLFQGALIAATQGVKWDIGNRDSARQKSALQGRAGRTVANHIEGMLLYIPLVIVAHLSEVTSSMTVWGATLYLAGRIAYVPLYLVGVPVVRTLSWVISIVGIILIAIETVKPML